jgi:hypothetical protein
MPRVPAVAPPAPPVLAGINTVAAAAAIAALAASLSLATLTGCAGSSANRGDDEASTGGLSKSKKPSVAQYKLVGPAGTVMKLPSLTTARFQINGQYVNVRPFRFDGTTLVRFPGRCRDGYQGDAALPKSDAWPVEMTFKDPEEQNRLLYAHGLLCFFTRASGELDPEFFEMALPEDKIRSLKRGKNVEILGKDKGGTPLYKFTLSPGA